MSAANLPTEIVQSILLFTNPDTFCSARLACSSWLHASSTSFMLRKALDRAPFSRLLPPLNLLNEDDWNLLFNQVAHLHLLGRRDHIIKETSRRNLPRECGPSSSMAVSRDGRKLVVLKGSSVHVYSLGGNDEDGSGGGGTFEFAFERSLYPLWSTVFKSLTDGGSGFFNISERFAKYHLAMSRDAHVVALGLGKSIQIYDLGDDNDDNKSCKTKPPIEYILGTTESFFSTPPSPDYRDTDGVISSLEFTESDNLLRVVIEHESSPPRPSRVRYLGNPFAVSNSQSRYEYWKENINRIHLDSVAVASTFLQQDTKTAFRGMQLLPNSFICGTHTIVDEPGRFFASGINTSTMKGYCIGFVPDADQRRVSIHKLFPTRSIGHDQNESASTITGASSSSHWICTSITSPNSNNTIYARDACVVAHNLKQARERRWDPVNLPCGTSAIPVLGVSNDSKLLVVFEAGAGHSYCSSSGGALYVYSLESCASMPGPFRHLEGVIQSWSFLLDIVDVDIERIRVNHHSGGNGYTVMASSGREVIQWQLH